MLLAALYAARARRGNDPLKTELKFDYETHKDDPAEAILRDLPVRDDTRWRWLFSMPEEKPASGSVARGMNEKVLRSAVGTIKNSAKPETTPAESAKATAAMQAMGIGEKPEAKDGEGDGKEKDVDSKMWALVGKGTNVPGNREAPAREPPAEVAADSVADRPPRGPPWVTPRMRPRLERPPATTNALGALLGAQGEGADAEPPWSGVPDRAGSSNEPTGTSYPFGAAGCKGEACVRWKRQFPYAQPTLENPAAESSEEEIGKSGASSGCAAPAKRRELCEALLLTAARDADVAGARDGARGGGVCASAPAGCPHVDCHGVVAAMHIGRGAAHACQLDLAPTAFGVGGFVRAAREVEPRHGGLMWPPGGQPAQRCTVDDCAAIDLAPLPPHADAPTPDAQREAAQRTQAAFGLPFRDRAALPWSFRGHTYAGASAARRDEEDGAKAVSARSVAVLRRAAAAAGDFAGAPCTRSGDDGVPAWHPCHVLQPQ